MDMNSKEQLWKASSCLGDKEGFRHNVYWVRGDIYRGYWSHNKRHGVGIHIYKSGNKYEGEWNNGKRDGQGTLWIANGGKYQAIYRGSWKEGKWHGQGILYGKCGETYEGEFKNGKRHGNGKQTYWCDNSKSYNVYTGGWVDDKREGIGAFKMVNGDVYEGMFLNDMKEGSGCYFYTAKGCKYDGLWKADKPLCGTYSRIKGSDNNSELPFLELKDSKNIAELFMADKK